MRDLRTSPRLVPHHSRPVTETLDTRSIDRRPATGAWPNYAGIALIGYLIYGLGAVGPYLRIQLHLSDAEVGLHSTGLALGITAAGILAGNLGRRFGEIPVRAIALCLLGLAIVSLAAAPGLAVTLAAAVLIGLGTGTVLGYANATLAAPGGVRARLQVARANVWAMVAAFVGPLMLAAGASDGPGWWIGFLPAAGLLAVLALDLRAGPRLEVPATTADGDPRLPRGFWIAWTFLVASIAVEFSVVFWAATLVQRRTAVTVAEATLLGALFFAGMFTGRLGLAFGLGTGHDVRRPATIGLVLALVGTGVAWLSTVPLLSGGALFVAGLGVAILYPLGVAAALATVPGRLAQAGARLNLATGVAIVTAPFALGVVADLAGVIVGWGVVIGLVLVAIVFASRLPRGALAPVPTTAPTP